MAETYVYSVMLCFAVRAVACRVWLPSIEREAV